MADKMSATATAPEKEPKKNKKAPAAAKKAAKGAKAAAPEAKGRKAKEPKEPKAPKAPSKYSGCVLTKINGVTENPYKEGSLLAIAYNTLKSGTTLEKLIETTGDTQYYKYVRRMVRHGNLTATPK